MGIECNPGKHDNGDKLRQSSIDFSTDSSTIEFFSICNDDFSEIKSIIFNPVTKRNAKRN